MTQFCIWWLYNKLVYRRFYIPKDSVLHLYSCILNKESSPQLLFAIYLTHILLSFFFKYICCLKELSHCFHGIIMFITDSHLDCVVQLLDLNCPYGPTQCSRGWCAKIASMELINRTCIGNEILGFTYIWSFIFILIYSWWIGISKKKKIYAGLGKSKNNSGPQIHVHEDQTSTASATAKMHTRTHLCAGTLLNFHRHVRILFLLQPHQSNTCLFEGFCRGHFNELHAPPCQFPSGSLCNSWWPNTFLVSISPGPIRVMRNRM